MPCKNAVLRGQLSIHYLLKFMLHQQGRSLPKIWGRAISLISDEWQYFVWDTAYQSTKWLDILNIWSWPWLPRPSRLRLWRGAVMLHCDKNHHKSTDNCAFCDHQPNNVHLFVFRFPKCILKESLLFKRIGSSIIRDAGLMSSFHFANGQRPTLVEIVVSASF